jgi:hypothetical protein
MSTTTAKENGGAETTAPISGQYAKRVIAAMIGWGGNRFTPEIADDIATTHITDIELYEDPMVDGDVLVQATLRNVTEINHSKSLGLFNFSVGQIGALRYDSDSGGLNIRFSGFTPEHGEEVTVEYEDKLAKSPDGIKCVFDLQLDLGDGR